jgi:hypothetical protein
MVPQLPRAASKREGRLQKRSPRDVSPCSRPPREIWSNAERPKRGDWEAKWASSAESSRRRHNAVWRLPCSKVSFLMEKFV